jgi:hypothetical protein
MRIYSLLLPLLVHSVVHAEECQMKPPPLDTIRFAQSSQVKSFVLDRSKLAMTVLLKNGQTLRLVHAGCMHSGAEATLWLEVDIDNDDTDAWLKEAKCLAQLAFPASIASAIASSISRKEYERSGDRSRILYSGSVSTYMTYSIVVANAEHRRFLSISYVIG